VVTPAGTIEFAYDVWGRKISRSAGSAVVRYVYDGARVLVERDKGGAVLAKYVYGAGLDEVLRMDRGTSSYYLFHDGLGSVVNATDGSGENVESYGYDVFGKATVRNKGGTIINKSTVGNAYLFTGREYDDNAVLYYFRARWYDPDLGRFLTPDPIGFAGGQTNLYAYVGNNPVGRVDPEGYEMSWEESMGLTNAVTGLVAGIFTGIGIVAIGASTLAGAPLLVSGITVAGLGAYAYGRWSAAKEQLDAASKGKQTFNPNNPCEKIAASPFGGIPFVNAGANWYYPEGKTSTMIYETVKSGTKVLLPKVLDLPLPTMR